VSSQTVGENPSVQALSYSQELFYKNDAIRNTVLLGRDLINDDGLTKAWALSYPFMNRWEYWLQVFGVANIPDDLFDNTVPFDGMNNLWDRLASIEGWVLNYRIRFVIEQNGQQFEQIIDTPLASTYFNSNTDWINCRLKSYNITDTGFTSPLENGSTKYLYNNDKVRIRAEFEKVGTPLGLDRIAIVLFCESFEGNGEREICLISSVRDVRSDSFFVPENGVKRVQVTQDGNVYYGTAVLDGNKLKGRKYTLYGRIYELVEGEFEDGRITNDLILRELLNGEIRFIL
jgi:hypothetical protein